MTDSGEAQKMTNERNAANFGFLPGGTPEENTRALQAALDRAGTIRVDVPGVYDVAGPVKIGGNTALEFGAGVALRRRNTEGYTLINKGAYTGISDENIRITGLRLIVNGCDLLRQEIVGMNAHIGFHHVKNLVIRDFACQDLMARGFCLQICTFENIVLENLLIEGGKDAVHLGRGRKFAILHGVFRTFDDPIALNAHDYVCSNPQFGWIEDGVIEDCYDLDQPETTGFFCRLLGGAWTDWKAGMPIRRSDLVVSGGNLYSACLPVDGRERISHTSPTHEAGIVELDGIPWRFVQRNREYNCGVRNVHFRDIFLEKRRTRAFSLTFDDDKWSRSVYPGAELPMFSDIILENIFFRNRIDALAEIRTPCDTLKIINSVMDNSTILLNTREYLIGQYPPTKLLFSGTTFKGNGGVLVEAQEGRSAAVRLLGSMPEREEGEFLCRGKVRVLASDVRLRKID